MRSRRERKGKKLNFTLSKENLFLLILVALFIFIFIGFIFIYQVYAVRANFEKDVVSIANANENAVFSLDKLFLFSSSDAIQNETQKASWDLNIYQYTDIAIYLNPHAQNGYTKENTLKQVWIDTIEYSVMPTLGTPSLFYKDRKDFGKSSMLAENKIQDRLDFTITTSSETIDTTKPTLANSASTPITLEFVNQEIKKNAIIPATEGSLIFDGNLLKKANISLASISCQVSFRIHIINNLDEHFVCHVSIPIPLEDTSTGENIYQGTIKKELTNLSNNQFYKK